MKTGQNLPVFGFALRESQRETICLSLEDSKLKLSNIAYAIRRLIDFESAWIGHFHQYDEKITIGLSIGLLAPILKIIDNRLREMITIGDPVFFASSRKYVEFLDQVSQETNLEKIKRFINSITTDLLTYSKDLMMIIDPLYDHPSVLCLRNIKLLLEQKSETLLQRGWNDTIEIIPLSIQDSNKIFWGRKCKIPEILDNPNRPKSLQVSSKTILDLPPFELVKTDEGMRKFLHFIYSEIEIPAAEICARDIVEFGKNMPIDFIVDLARQCSDEARHALMIAEMMIQYNVNLGDYPYKNFVWNQCLLGETLAEKLAIEQLIAEGNGLDGSSITLPAIEAANRNTFAKYYKYLLADETVHCEIGNRWVYYLVGNDPEGYEKIIDTALEKSGLTVPGKAPVNVDIRRAAGFREEFIEGRLLSVQRNLPTIGKKSK